MEGTISNGGNSSDLFFDAFDAFTPPDFNENFNPIYSSPPGKIANKPNTNIKDATIFNVGETSTSTLSSDQTVEYPSQSLLVSLADLVIQAMFFQVNMLIRCLTFPIWLTYNSLLFAANPLGTLRRSIYTLKKSFCPFVPEMLKREEGVVKLVGRMAWGCFWFLYVGIALSGLLMTGFFCAGFLMSRVVEEPLQMIKRLDFDYTKTSPDVVVMLRTCDGVGCSLDFDGKNGFVENVVGRVIPLNHKLRLSISLTLPESDYNRNLGVFQVCTCVLLKLGIVVFNARILFNATMERLEDGGKKMKIYSVFNF